MAENERVGIINGRDARGGNDERSRKNPDWAKTITINTHVAQADEPNQTIHAFPEAAKGQFSQQRTYRPAR
jgi:sensor domain CHASE-containing protein